jgi:putative ubiquitin-RnfH superfamily antitoxin RatB of RatAB toxin-antitoxin module
MGDAGFVNATVIYSPGPRDVREWPVTLPAGSSVMQALRASGFETAFPQMQLARVVVGVWGRKARMEQILRDGDRVEIYRPLEVDPKVARRERFKKQGVRAAGLFSRKPAPEKGDS